MKKRSCPQNGVSRVGTSLRYYELPLSEPGMVNVAEPWGARLLPKTSLAIGGFLHLDNHLQLSKVSVGWKPQLGFIIYMHHSDVHPPKEYLGSFARGGHWFAVADHIGDLRATNPVLVCGLMIPDGIFCHKLQIKQGTDRLSFMNSHV